jgi:hypothetical protein
VRFSFAKMALPMGLAPTPDPQTTGGSALSYGSKWWEVLVTLQFVASDFAFATPDLQAGNRITSRNW